MRTSQFAALTVVGLVLSYALSDPAGTHAQDVIQLRTAPPDSAATAATPAETGPLQFEVASVKPNKSGGGQVSIGIQPGGRFQATNVTLRDLLRIAYQVQPFQIVGGPSWVQSDRFDIAAKAESDFPATPPVPGGPPGVPQRMLQGLLAERFKLATRTETRDMPIYDLVLVRRDGQLGDKLKASTLDCASIAAARRGGGPPAQAGQAGRGGAAGANPCGMRIGPGVLNGNAVSMAFLANSLSQMVQRVVTDKTGLSGNFEFEVTFTPEGPQPGPVAPPPGAPPLPPIDPNAPTIYTAVQEQLGLKLEGARGPVSVLVIDKVEAPTPD